MTIRFGTVSWYLVFGVVEFLFGIRSLGSCREIAGSRDSINTSLSYRNSSHFPFPLLSSVRQPRKLHVF